VKGQRQPPNLCEPVQNLAYNFDMGQGSRVRVGASSFTAAGWETAFYPPGLKDADRLSYYAEQFDTVEIDATFYRVPTLRTCATGMPPSHPTSCSH